jgi:hypothetical protein
MFVVTQPARVGRTLRLSRGVEGRFLAQKHRSTVAVLLAPLVVGEESIARAAFATPPTEFGAIERDGRYPSSAVAPPFPTADQAVPNHGAGSGASDLLLELDATTAQKLGRSHMRGVPTGSRPVGRRDSVEKGFIVEPVQTKEEERFILTSSGAGPPYPLFDWRPTFPLQLPWSRVWPFPPLPLAWNAGHCLAPQAISSLLPGYPVPVTDSLHLLFQVLCRA